MEKSEKIQFQELLEQRRKLCKEGLNQIKKTTMKDSQLKDTVKNFKEGTKYKKII